jgi:EAL domain-containing protein (putative c-di-GMP-specific phosphodiesterase class I)
VIPVKVPGNPVYLNNYTPAADVATISVCFVISILLLFSYTRKSNSYRVFLSIIPTLIIACMADIGFHMALSARGLSPLAYTLRCVYHAGLFMVFFLFTLYITIVTRLKKKVQTWIVSLSALLLLAVIVVDVITSFGGRALTLTENGIVSSGSLIFFIGYILFSVTDVVLLALVRNRLYKRVMFGFYGSVALSFLVIFIQRLFGQSSFTALSFLFPLIAMFYIMHSSPFNAELGSVDSAALHDTVRYNYEKKKSFIYMSLYMPTFDAEGRQMPESLQALVRRFASNYFRSALLFNVGRGQLILLFPKSRNSDYEHRIGKILRSFSDQHRIYQYDYKIVIGESNNEISRKNEYVSFIRNINRAMKDNTIHRVSPDDLKAFDRSEYILHQLENIYLTHDLNDKRVLVYCQPVYNIRTGKYDTAEALMRLMLPETGLVFPDQFIYLAEDYGYIHVLTEIILHKTCEEMHRLIEDGYEINRISVNVSMLELKDDHFCEDISGVVADSGISADHIAIELTESQSESDFNLMKTKIEELKDKGIKFYLDDFGTGYSNMERIMELPFDIIKFDRSLVLASGSSERSEKIVCNLANLFNDLDYSVLYEGVETESDETMCKEMSASYLQGYKYSRPIPIEELRHFAEKKGRAG